MDNWLDDLVRARDAAREAEVANSLPDMLAAQRELKSLLLGEWDDVCTLIDLAQKGARCEAEHERSAASPICPACRGYGISEPWTNCPTCNGSGVSG